MNREEKEIIYDKGREIYKYLTPQIEDEFYLDAEGDFSKNAVIYALGLYRKMLEEMNKY